MEDIIEMSDVEGRDRESETIFTASAIPHPVVKKIKRGRKGEIKNLICHVINDFH